MTTNYHDAIVATDKVRAKTINRPLRQLDQQLSDMNDGTHPFSAIDVDGGDVDAVIGANSAGAGTFTDLTVNNNLAVGSALMVGIRFGQSIGSGVTATIEWNRVYLDTDDAYDPSTFRWTPTTAGYYLIATAVTLDTVAAGKAQLLSIRKGGFTVFSRAEDSHGSFSETINAMALVNMNGSTDYIDIQLQNNGTGNNFVLGDDFKSFFAGARVF